MRASCWRDNVGRAIAVLAPITALLHTDILDSPPWFAQLLPPANFPPFQSCSRVPGGPPDLKGAVVLSLLGEVTFAHAVWVTMLLFALTVFTWPCRAPAQRDLRFIVPLTVAVSTATFSTFIVASASAIMAQVDAFASASTRAFR